MDIKEVVSDAKRRMSSAVEDSRKKLASVRTGRATISILDSVTVEYYGTEMPLNQVATIHAPEPTMLTVQPFDPTQIAGIEKAIRASDLGLNPSNDGKLVRVPIPPLTEERRKQMVKVVHDIAEEHRTAIRNVRRDANKHADQAEKDKVLTEDELESTKEKVQNLTKSYEGQVNDIADKKSAEILEE